MPTATLARSVLLEARRGGLPWLALGAVAFGLGLAAFVSQVALTESLALQAALVAAVLRACAVFLVAAQVTASTLREIQDKGLELMLSLPLSRTTHYLGRLAGFVACGAALALAFALPLLLWAAPGGGRALGAVARLRGRAGRSGGALLRHDARRSSCRRSRRAPACTCSRARSARSRPSQPGRSPSPRSQAASPQYAVDAVALVLPRLEAVTRTAWLLYEPPAAGTYAAALGSALLYAALLSAAGLFDFHRKSV